METLKMETTYKGIKVFRHLVAFLEDCSILGCGELLLYTSHLKKNVPTEVFTTDLKGLNFLFLSTSFNVIIEQN